MSNRWEAKAQGRLVAEATIQDRLKESKQYRTKSTIAAFLLGIGGGAAYEAPKIPDIAGAFLGGITIAVALSRGERSVQERKRAVKECDKAVVKYFNVLDNSYGDVIPSNHINAMEHLVKKSDDKSVSDTRQTNKVSKLLRSAVSLDASKAYWAPLSAWGVSATTTQSVIKHSSADVLGDKFSLVFIGVSAATTLAGHFDNRRVDNIQANYMHQLESLQRSTENSA